MAELLKYVKAQTIITNMDCENKQQAITMLVEKAFNENNKNILDGLSKQQAANEIIERENISTTGIGNTLAFPHGRFDQCSDLVVAIGVCKKTVDFNSVDKKKCRIVCLMLSPAKKPYIILQLMAALTAVLREEKNVEKITKMKSPQQVAQFLTKTATTDSRAIFAKDIMRPVKKVAKIEEAVEKITRIMHLKHYDVLPVVNDENVLCGQISCLNIFAYGIPDFFKQLQTVSFVRFMDPFEKYFKLKKDLKVKDLYEPHISIDKNATLMEIIFQMVAKNEAEIFVVDEGKLVGIIDRFSIIDRILFF